MTWYRVAADSIPSWMPRRVFAEMPGVTAPCLPGYRCIGMRSDIDATVWVPRWLSWYAVTELFLLAVITNVATFLARHEILTGEPGCFLWDLRLNDPANWRWR
jgi:hypothetical protein